ncbi:DUF742 domain-containing protein [Actinomycetospora sp. OC33-EN08]|uniref:DUF742 domain-containing protein n=1 Tax=Actinomycetospora aurantiaca TaxID=3129233 RepID=A0ABU8MVI8_9PSEU
MTDDEDTGRRSRPRRSPRVGRTGARFPRAPQAAPEEPDRAPESPAVPAPTEPGDPMIGRTGARFGSHARRTRRENDLRAAEDAVVPVQAPPRPRADPSDPSDPSAPRPDDSATAPLHLAELRNRVEGYESRVSVRPYVRTRGRTRARADLRVETLVSLPSPRPALDDPEHVAIGDLCDGAPRSVAEVAALLRVPLGVARVLIGDMADQGSVTIHPTAASSSSGPGPDRAVMARVLQGLHRL